MAAKINAGLNVGAVIVAIEERYNDNDGAYSFAWVLEGDKLYTVSVSNGHNGGRFDDAVVDATPEQVAIAAEIYANEKRMTAQWLDCTVILARSRKAPNRVPLLVVDYATGGYNARFNQYDPEQVCVLVEGEKTWVNATCVKGVVKGAYPYWKQ